MKNNPAKLTPDNALLRLMDICSRSEKSAYEIALKLKDWGLEKQAAEILEKLRTENFINESRFATAFARDKAKFNKWGKTKIRYSLKGHQISSPLIENALDQIDPETYRNMIWNELDRKLKSIKSMGTFQKKAKLYAFGNQRGYEPDLLNEYFVLKGL